MAVQIDVANRLCFLLCDVAAGSLSVCLAQMARFVSVVSFLCSSCSKAAAAADSGGTDLPCRVRGWAALPHAHAAGWAAGAGMTGNGQQALLCYITA